MIRCAIAVAVLAGLASAAALAQKLGEQAPEINVPNYLGAEDHISLAKYRGKIVVLVFWRSDIAASVDILTKLNAIHKKLFRNGVIIMALTPEDKDKAESIAKGKDVTFIVGFGGAVDDLYKVATYPQAFIIDTKGVVTWRGHPGDDLEDRLRKQIELTPPAGADAAALSKRMSEATTAQDAGEIGKAYSIAKEVADLTDEKSTQGEKARGLMKTLEEKAKKVIDDAKSASGDKSDEAMRKLAEISVRMAGTDAGRAAEDEVGKLRADAKTKAAMDKAVKEARARVKFEQAADLESKNDYAAAVTAYREVTEKHAGTQSASDAQKAIDRVNNDPAIQKKIRAARAEQEADRWLDLGDRFARVDMKDKAIEQYEAVIQKHPSTKAAEKAKSKLAKLKG